MLFRFTLCTVRACVFQNLDFSCEPDVCALASVLPTHLVRLVNRVGRARFFILGELDLDTIADFKIVKRELVFLVRPLGFACGRLLVSRLPFADLGARRQPHDVNIVPFSARRARPIVVATFVRTVVRAVASRPSIFTGDPTTVRNAASAATALLVR